MKTCTRCKQTKDVDDFYWKKKDSGVRSHCCKSCQNEYSKQHYAGNQEAYKQKAKRNRKPYISKKTREQSSIDKILAENSGYATQYVKRRILSESVKEYLCEDCGISDYNGKDIVLQLHHVDGNNKNHSLSNLQLLCPNCHSQTHNFAGRKRSFRSSTE